MPLSFESPLPERYSKHEVEWYWRKAILQEVKNALPNYNDGKHPNSEFWAGVETVINVIMKRNVDETEE